MAIEIDRGRIQELRERGFSIQRARQIVIGDKLRDMLNSAQTVDQLKPIISQLLDKAFPVYFPDGPFGGVDG